MDLLVYFLLCLAGAFGQVDEGIDEEFYDIFDTGVREWRMAFRGTQGINEPLWIAYEFNQTVAVGQECQGMEPDPTCTHHFRNNAVMNDWTNIDQVAMVIFKDGSMVANVVFDGKGSTFLTWFTQARVVSSSWTDLTSTHANYFSIQGHHAVNRHFYMNAYYHGCPGDAGWFVAMDTVLFTGNPPHCPWEFKYSHTFPQFLYSSKPTAVNWNSVDIHEGDVMGIYTKYSTSGGVIG